MSSHFGATLRLLRHESGLSLRDLARRLGVSGAYLSRVETGLDPTPTPARIDALARELGVPSAILIDIAHRISPVLVEYVDEVPEAGAFLLEVANRRLSADQIAELRAFVKDRFGDPTPRVEALPTLADVLTPECVILGLSGATMDDVLDLAASRIAAANRPFAAPTIADALKQHERQVSSAIGGSVAVCSVALSGLAPTAALITLAEPLDLPTPDNEPIRVVVAIAGSGGRERLLRLAHVARLAGRGLADQVAAMDTASRVLARVALLESWC